MQITSSQKAVLATLLAGCAVITAVWAASGWIIWSYARSPVDRGTFGDMFGAVNALFTGWAFLGVIVTLAQQNAQLDLQRLELKLSRESTEGTVRILSEERRQSDFSVRLRALTELHRSLNGRIDRLIEPHELHAEASRLVGERDKVEAELESMVRVFLGGRNSRSV